jgi:RNA polymerase sigma-70 factor (ECF subfamily)
MKPVPRIEPNTTSSERNATQNEDFETIVAIYRPRIFRFALESLRDRDLAETVTQDCFLKAYKGWGQFRGDSSVHTWLMLIAANLVRDVGRNRRFQFWKRAQASAVDVGDASDWIPSGDMSSEEQVAARQQVEAIWTVLASLSANQRTVFLLHFMEEMDPGEIEAATGITRAAVKVHLFRAVQAIRERLRRLE